MSTVIASVVSEVKQHLERNPTLAFRAVPLAKAIGEKDIRRVRQAIQELKDRGEVVSCTVYRGDEPADEEVRLSAAPIHLPPQPTVRRYPEALHREPLRPLASAPERKRSTPGWTESKASPAPQEPAPETPASEEVPACIRRRRDPVSHLGPRQRSIIEMIQLKNKAMTVTELREALNAAGDMVSENPVATAIGLMKASGVVVVCGKRRPVPEGRPAQTYATPAIAERLAKETASAWEAAMTTDTKGSDGETTPPESAVPGEAGPAPAAPQAAIDTAPEKTVQAPAQARVEALRRDDAPTDGESPHWEALQRLAAHFAGSAQSDGAWHGFVWLVRVAGGDAPTTMEILAAWQRDGRIAYSVADRSPIWRAVEGRW